MVAGLEEVTEGELRIGDRVVNDLAPQERDIAMVFQNYALYPHMSVFDNIAFPLESQRMKKAEVRERVTKPAELLGLTEHLKRRPRNLSGGQRQRVAMGRAIVREPQVFLMDEPLSNLDAKLRVQMRAEITRLQEQLGVTTIFVTHDQVEAMTMGDRIAVMRKGVLQQQGAARPLYDEPANLFVAEFIGSPAMNLFRSRFDGDKMLFARRPASPSTGKDLHQRSGLATVPRTRRRRRHPARASSLPLRRPTVSIRYAPEVRFSEALPPERLVHATARRTPPVLTDAVLEIAADVDEAAVEQLHELEPTSTRDALLRALRIARATRRAARTSSRSIADRMHFFDLDTGSAIR